MVDNGVFEANMLEVEGIVLLWVNNAENSILISTSNDRGFPGSDHVNAIDFVGFSIEGGTGGAKERLKSCAYES